MNEIQLKRDLAICLEARLPVLIKGAPGIGKSDIVLQASDSLGMRCMLFHPVVSDPTDYKGLPALVEGKAEFLPYGQLRSLVDVKEPTVAFLDDLGQAPAVVQAAVMQLLLAREVNGVRISDHVVFVAATNRREDKAGVTGILSPVKSRFAAIVELEVEKDAWIEWALQNGVPSGLVGFVHFRPDVLNTPKATNDIVNGPCPRTLAFCGKLMRAGLNSIEWLSGAIGDGWAGELCGFLRVYKDLPDLDGIVKNPMEAKVPTEPSALYAVVSALVERMNLENADNIFKYAGRLPKDFSVLLVRDAIRAHEEIQKTRGFIDWAVANKEVLM